MDISLAVRNYIDTAKQAALPVVVKLKKLRSNPDFFQKVAQVAFASIQLLIISSQKAAHLARFSFVLATANMHDFYRFIQYPQKLFFPVTVQSINEYTVSDDVFSFICDKYSDDVDNVDTDELEAIIDMCLEKQLEQMAASGDSYRDIKQFQEALQKHLRQYHRNPEVLASLQSPNDPDELEQRVDAHNYLKTIDLSGLNQFIEQQGRQTSSWFRPVSLLDRIISINWVVVDFGCVAHYLQGWKLLNTAKWAERIGQYSVLQWVKNTQLGTFVLGGVVTGFALQLVESVRKLKTLTPQDRCKELLNVITPAAECLLYGATFLNQIGKISTNVIYLHCFAIVAKSLGLISIVIRPEQEFFQEPTRVI